MESHTGPHNQRVFRTLQVLNLGKRGAGQELKEGMVFTIEPMINQGTRLVMTKGDGWTVVIKDRKLSAQFEHTVAVTKSGVEILTLRRDEISRLGLGIAGLMTG